MRVIAFLGVIVAFLVGAAILTYINRAPAANGALVTEVTHNRRPVKITVVEPTTMVERLESTGVLNARQDVVLTTEVGGKIKQVLKDLGDRCERGELLIRLDGEGYRIAVTQAKAMVKQNAITLEHAERDLQRLRKLSGSAAVTDQQLDAAEGGVQAGAAALEQARAGLQAARRNLRETAVRCPFSGIVAQRMVEQGQTVGPQTPLARLIDAEQLELVISVTAAELARIETDMEVELDDPELPGQVSRGTVSRLGVVADESTRTFPVEVIVDDGASKLRAGQVVRAMLVLARHVDALSVPVEAVATADDGSSVLVVRDEHARRIEVVTGAQIDGRVIVTSGLGAGDAVITVGGDELIDGSAVEIVVDEPTGEPAPQTPSAQATK